MSRPADGRFANVHRWQMGFGLKRTTGPLEGLRRSKFRRVARDVRLASLPLALLLLIGCGPKSAPPIDGWVRAEAPDLTISSELDPVETAELAEQMEIFQKVVRLFTNAGDRQASVPTYVFAFGNSSHFRSFVPGGNRNVAGYFHDTYRANYLVTDQTKGLDAMYVTFHEYTHFLVRNQTSLVYPTWFDEGFAEYMGATRIEEDRVIVGGILAERWALDGWMPMREVLTTESTADWPHIKQNLFYRQAWALVHYLMTQQLQDGSFPRRMTEYLNLCEAGEPADDAFAKSFEIPIRELDRRIQGYLKNRNVRARVIPRSALESDTLAAVHAMPQETVASELGSLALTLQELDTAEALYRAALERDPHHSRALAGLGDVYKFRDKRVEAEPYFLRAIEENPNEALNHLDYAEYLQENARREPIDSEARLDLYTKAREHYVKAWKLAPEAPEVYVMYGTTFLEVGDDPKRALELMEASQALLPGDLELRLLLAKAYADQGRSADARPLLESVVAWSHDESRAAHAKKLLSDIPNNANDRGAHR